MPDIRWRYTGNARLTHSTHTWNLTTHLIDPYVDEARDYLVQDLLFSERISRVGYVHGSSPATPSVPHRNLTGDPYITDGLRAVPVFSAEPVRLSTLQTFDWDWPKSLKIVESAPWQ